MTARDTDARGDTVPRPRTSETNHAVAGSRTTNAAPATVGGPAAGVDARALGLPEGVEHGYGLDPATRQPVTARLTTRDGSCKVALTPQRPGQWSVKEAGLTRLWSHIEEAFRAWDGAGRPGWERFGLTVTREGTTPWLNNPDDVIGFHDPAGGWHASTSRGAVHPATLPH
jgi:hypothetical protein